LHTPALGRQKEISLIIIDLLKKTPSTAPPLFVNAICKQMNRANAIERIAQSAGGNAAYDLVHGAPRRAALLFVQNCLDGKARKFGETSKTEKREQVIPLIT
jgi:hypothetical protein